MFFSQNLGPSYQNCRRSWGLTQAKWKKSELELVVSVARHPRSDSAQVLDEGLQVGASVTLTRLMDMLALMVRQRCQSETRTYRAMHEQLRYFAGPPIRNTASVGGNIATGSPISDLNPLYMACGATFIVAGKGTPERQVSPSEQRVLQPVELRMEMCGGAAVVRRAGKSSQVAVRGVTAFAGQCPRLFSGLSKG